MNKIKCCILVAVALSSMMTFAAKDSTFKFQNSVRVGYDDNVYQSRDSNKQETGFITDIFNITGTLDFSERTAMELYWQPEIRYRFDADPEVVTYQNLYARLNHDITERAGVEVSDRFRYQAKDGQSDLPGQQFDQNYLENDLMGLVDYSLSRVNQVRVGAGYEFRIWDDDTYGEVIGNNYDQFRVNGSYIHALNANTTYGVAGVNYVDHEYDGSRGGFDSTSIYGGVDHNFNPDMLGSAYVGASFSSVDGSTGSQDTSSPYLQAAMDYKPTDPTSINGSMSYSLSQSENSVYNAADTFDLGIGVQHDITAKISCAATLNYIFAMYDSDYARLGLGDADEDFVRASIRGSYQINRNNFVDLGYEFSKRDSDSPLLQEYDRNRVDIGWRLRF